MRQADEFSSSDLRSARDTIRRSLAPSASLFVCSRFRGFARNVCSVFFHSLHVVVVVVVVVVLVVLVVVLVLVLVVILFIVVIVVIEACTAGTGLLVGETTSQWGWNGKFPPHVEQNVRLTFSNSVGGCRSYGAIVKVEPLTVMYSEGSVMSSSSTAMQIHSKSTFRTFASLHTYYITEANKPTSFLKKPGPAPPPPSLPSRATSCNSQVSIIVA